MIAAGTAVFYQDSILLAKRILEHEGRPVTFGGYWSIFTGAVEEDDLSIVHAAQRELKEEAGFNIPTSDLFFLDQVKNKDCTLSVYGYESPELLFPLLDFEHTEWGWFKMETLESFPELLDEKLRQLLIKYHKSWEK